MVRKWIVPAMLAVSAMPSIADEMPYDIGTTAGTFSVAQSVLTFTGTDPGSGSTSGGSATLANLGTFDAVLAGSSSVNLSGYFNLTLTFLVPDGDDLTSPIVASVAGTINTQVGNNVLIDFNDLGQTVNFSGTNGSGSFLLKINDVSFSQFRGAASQTLTGSISGATLTPPEIVTNSVPAPATVALLGIGFAGLGVARRRKAQ